MNRYVLAALVAIGTLLGLLSTASVDQLTLAEVLGAAGASVTAFTATAVDPDRFNRGE